MRIQIEEFILCQNNQAKVFDQLIIKSFWKTETYKCFFVFFVFLFFLEGKLIQVILPIVLASTYFDYH